MEIKLIDGKVIEIKNNERIIDFISSRISNSLAKKALYVKINNEEYNLEDYIVTGELQVITSENNISNKKINLNAALLINKSIKNFIDCKIVNIQANEEEFLIDFEVKENISEKLITEIIKKSLLEKLFLEDLTSKDQIICNKMVKFIEVTSISGLSSETKSNRIVGFGSTSLEDFENQKNQIKERNERDHRKIGKELEIFMIDEQFGRGFPIWLPNGVALKTSIRNFIFKQEKKYKYIQVETPALGSLSFYETSGHYEHYKDSMFPIMKIEDNENYILRPMACPHHCLIYRSKPRSYKELPIRYAEQVKQYRFEYSGALLGLERVRAMELTDSHIFLKMNQLKEELKKVYQLISSTLNKFNIRIKYVELALHDSNNKEKYHGDEETWIKAEQYLREFLKEEGIDFQEKQGEAAFYGPKIDIQIETALKHIITLSTIQLDFFLPERFDLNYINVDNKLERVIMIHRGLIGTYERFISVLLEQTKGDLPMWLAPRQVVILPIKNDLHLKYSEELNDLLIDNDIRSEIDDSDERLSYKIRKYQVNKVKIQIVIGDEEVKNKTVTYRNYGETIEKTISIKELLTIFKSE